MKCTNGKPGLQRAVALGSVLLLVVAGCKSPSGKGGSAVAVKQALVGKDGARTVTAANTIVNRYSALVADAAAGTSAVTVNAMSDLATDLGSDGGLQPLAVGDLLLVIQMAGATIDSSDTPDYGTVSDANLNNAGNYELAGVAGVTTSTNTITLSCPLKKSYTATGKAQVIRVAQYTTLTINSGASITAPAWDGTVGGVVAVHAATTLQLDGAINVSAKGFRGGATDNSSAAPGSNVVVYRSANATDGAEKGESIAGLPADFGTGRYGRGAPANGGGGGDSHNAGGGGGANAAASGLTWTGQGVMLSSVLGGPGAWPLDPSSGGGFTNSSGGGRGGYTYSISNQNATTTDGGAGVAPGNALWAGDSRRQVGGLGGHPLTSSPTGRLFLGGGGGAGDGNDGHAGPGGVGGGLVFVIAGTVTGTGSILANGGSGGDSDSGTVTPANGDAPGGGGGGGTVVVHAGILSPVSIAANGGVGGNQLIPNGAGSAGTDEAEGPGGGGGGGYIAVSGGTPAAVSANGGLGGTTNSRALTEFPSNGATAGHPGVTDGDATAILYCTASVVLDTTIESAPAKLTNVAAATFTFSSPQIGVTFECSLDGVLPFAVCPATYTTPATLKDGPHTLDVRAKDLNGNVDDTPAHYDWTLDTVAPNARILTGPPDPSTSTTAHFTFSSDDTSEEGVTFQCRLGTLGDFAPCPADYTIDGLTDGSHTLYVRARDLAGNVSDPAASYTWAVHAAGVDAAVEDAAPGGQTIDGALVVEDAEAEDLAVDTGPRLDGAADGRGTVVFLDARADVAALVDLATNRDVPAVAADGRADAEDADVGLEDAIGDGGELEAGARDALVVVEPPSRDTGVRADQAVVLPPDAAGTTPDTAVPVVPNPDAAVNGMLKVMGSGFCAVNPIRNSAPGLFTLFLVAAFGLLLVLRRRR